MRWFRRAILAAGLATMALLLWRFEPALVWARIRGLGFGFLAILAFQIFDHMLNALGWRFAFSGGDAKGIPFLALIRGRVAGDGVNYLTPSGTIAGELIRPGLLVGFAPEPVRNASVVVAKLSQALGQALFILLGMLFVINGKLNLLSGTQRAWGIAGSSLLIGLISLAVYVMARKLPKTGKLAELGGQLQDYLARHPGRFSLSILFFIAGYAWGAAEVLLICHFMGLSLSVTAALAVEILSNLIDSLFFMVPAKVGTQEAGKTAIFHALGYAPAQGLAFGLIRHCREILWACLGLLLCLGRGREDSPLPASEPRLSARPLAPAD
ncbi:MAG: flippase-like domain-containing protein [Elusimicrobia bacterium]|nr:flippase-like domain-containing protein [Elusimicrobiota bacterium]